jgi:CO/xanthine dehydrogenase FAD-binding subunit
MVPLWQHYHTAESVADALQALAGAQGTVRVVAGGSDLLLELKQGRVPCVDALVDVTAVAEMTAIEQRQDRLFIGAAVPLSRVVQSERVGRHAAALVDACSLIGGPQVRNVATLGGNVAHALPAADGAIALLALDAFAEIAVWGAPRRELGLSELYRGPGESALDARRELLVGFYLRLVEGGQGSAFKRVMRPQGVALPVLNLACWLERADDRIASVCIAMGPAGRVPTRCRAAEQALTGMPFTQEAIAAAQAALLTEVHLRTSPHRATAEYRAHLSGVLLEDVLACAWQRGGECGNI